MKETVDAQESVACRSLATSHSLQDLINTVHGLAENLHNRLIGTGKAGLMKGKPTKAYTGAEEIARKVGCGDMHCTAVPVNLDPPPRACTTLTMQCA